jgi:hypothetical protein
MPAHSSGNGKSEGKTLEREKGKAMGRIVFCENGAEERI